MSSTKDFKSEALQDHRSASSANVFESLLGSKLRGNMSAHSRDTAVICSVSQLGPEPDSTDSTEETKILQLQSKFDKSNNILCKETIFPNSNISDKGCEPKVSIETLSGIVTLQDANVKNTTQLYSVLPETEDSDDSYNAVTSQNTATILPTSMDSAIVQNITKLPSNFTLNVDGNIATIQNVTQSVTTTTNQTLWLPTILATKVDNESVDSDRSQTTLSQIFVTGDNYLPHNNQNVIKRTNVITETSLQRQKSAKVQIISNITIPKQSYGHQGYLSPNSKEAEYATQNHLYKLSASVTSIPQKHVPNNSILNHKPNKTQSLITSPNVASLHPMQSQLKTSSSYASNFTHKTMNRSLNKVNNGANVSNNMLVSTSSPCHVLSRVVPGPKLHTARKNSFSGSKTAVKGDGRANANTAVLATQKGQSSRSIKIIQQTPSNSPHKAESKSWEKAHANVSSTKAATVSVIESTGKAVPPQTPVLQAKTAHNVVSLQRMPNKADQQQRIVLHSSCGQVIIPNSTTNTYQKATTQYNVQAGQHGTMRYVQSYVASESNQLSNVTQISANQHLTAQILQSLSQPKLVFQPSPAPLLNLPSSPKQSIFESEDITNIDYKVPVQIRQVHGDPSTMHMADDIVGIEERPTLSEDALYPYHALQLVMLDHTYAVSAQGMATISSSTQPVSQVGQALNTCTVMSPPSTGCPPSPAKLLASPPSAALVTGSCQTLSDTTARSLHTTYTIHTPLTPNTPPLTPHTPPSTASLQPTNLLYHSTLTKPTNDDDTASVASSIEEQHHRGNVSGGSDTETAPEGEEEGKTRCICEFTHDDGYMICCDRCSEWQHVDCMGIDRQNIPDTYMCERCQPRPIDRRRARLIQLRKREELSALAPSDSDSSEGLHHPLGHRRRLLTVTTYSNSSGPKPPGFLQPPLQTPVAPVPSLSLGLPPAKRGPKRPRRSDVIRKGTKRKHPEKRPKRKKDLMLNRSKYSATMQNQVHNWNDSYELAVTNHYSPELRAKIARYSNKLGNIPNMACAVTTHYCTTVPHAGGKILIATKDLKENTAVIELRGKYMLSTQHRSQMQVPSRSTAQKPGPFLFFYRLPRDNTQICIDTRTYGNEARFVRRSCKPNAELQHCIVKGALHVYLVTVGPIQSNTEIAIGHDINAGKQSCACENAKYCKMNGMSTAGMRKMLHTDYPREKRPRQRRSSSSSQASPTHGLIHKDTTPLKYFSPKIEKTSPIKTEIPFLTSPIRYEDKFTDLKIEPKIELKNDCKVEQEGEGELVLIKQECPKEVSDIPENVVKVESTADLIQNEHTPLLSETSKDGEGIKHELKIEDLAEIPIPPVYEKEVEEPVAMEVEQDMDLVKESDPKNCEPVEEIKHEPINANLVELDAKMTENLEVKKPELVDTVSEPNDDEKQLELKHIDEDKTLCQAVTRQTCPLARTTFKNTPATSCTPGNDSADDKMDDEDKNSENKMSNKDKKKMTREERKMEAIMKAFERMEKAEQRKQEVRERQTRRRESDPVQPSAEEQDLDEELTHSQAKKRRKRKGRARTISQNTWSNSRRLNSVDSDMVTSGDENTMTSPTPPHQPEHNNDILDSGRSEDVNISSACLLVEAAVGPLESAFKLPKTKKSIVSEWLGKSSESPSSPDGRPSASYDCVGDDARPYVPPKSNLLTPRSLQSLVRVASTLIGDLSGGTITADSSPEKNYFSGHSETDNSTPWGSPDKGLAKSPGYESPLQSPIRTPIKRSPRNTPRESPPRSIEKPKLPRKMKRGLRSVLEDRNTVTRRTLRSSVPTTTGQVNSDTTKASVELVERVESVQSLTPVKSVEPVQSAEPVESVESVEAAESVVRVSWSPTPSPAPPPVFQPPQHSAKKRWLRQAISEESDSPTAESPPSEMVTPLKKRRVARESLNREPSLLSSPLDDRTWSTTCQVDSSLQSQPQVPETDAVARLRNIKSDFSQSIYEDYRGEHTDSNDHSMECSGGYLDINLRNAHDTHKLKLDIHRIIGVPAPEDVLYSDNNVQDTKAEENRCVEPAQPTIVIQVEHEKEYLISQAAEKDLRLKEKAIEIESNFQDNNNSKGNDQSEEAEILKHKQETNVKLLEQIDTMTKIDEVSKLKAAGMKENDEDLNLINKSKDNSNKSDIIRELGITYLDIPLPQSDNAESKSEPSSNPHSTATSSSSSPMQSEMDDIQKKIHSFHTENIQILKIRNKKPPKSPQRKKVNLNFDLFVTDDQTVGVTLRTEKEQDEAAPLDIEVNGEIEDLSKKETESLNVSTSSIEVPMDEDDSDGKTESVDKDINLGDPAPIDEKKFESSETVSNFTFSSRFPTTSGLFADLFPTSKPILDETTPLSNVLPDMDIIKSAIDKTANMETCPFLDRTARTSVDELRNVQEILSRVNRMDSNNSVLLSGVLKESDQINIEPASLPSFSPAKLRASPLADPRLIPTPVEKPKPVRRKLSISEYRKRYNMQASCASGGADGTRGGGEGGSEDSSREASETGETGDNADNLDPELRLQMHLEESLNSLSSGAGVHGGPTLLPGEKGKGFFDAQPTQLERQRENLSERLRREFGLSLPEDEEARSATALQESGHLPGIPLPDNIPLPAPAPCPAFLRPPPPTKLPRFDR